jgi:hypothetical protein
MAISHTQKNTATLNMFGTESLYFTTSTNLKLKRNFHNPTSCLKRRLMDSLQGQAAESKLLNIC